MLYVAYLDEFGHIGPYVSRSDPRYKESPVFGLGGIVLPSQVIRHFGTWFYKRKCELLAFEIARDGEHPATWEKKGSALYTTQNVTRYAELRHFTNRFLNQIVRCGGFVFYVGIQKRLGADGHDSGRLYASVLREAIKRLDDFCATGAQHQLLIVMDEHPEREQILTQASRSMFGHGNPRRSLIEPPFQVESHRYQTMQAADWICGPGGPMGRVYRRSGRNSRFRMEPEIFRAPPAECVASERHSPEDRSGARDRAGKSRNAARSNG